MLFLAKFDGECGVCGLSVAKGELLSHVAPNTFTTHALCSEEGKKRAESARFSLPASFAKNIADFDVPTPHGLKLYPFQKAGIHFALTRPDGMGTLIADEMGLGKSAQALGYITALGITQIAQGKEPPRKVLINCPASLKFNWRNEAEQWLVPPSDIQVNSSQPLFDPEKALHVQITNYDRLGELAADIRPDIFIFDEAHYVKSRTSDRSGKVKYIAKQSAKIIALTGTPIPNGPEDLWPLLQILDPQRWQKFSEFASRYCAAETKYRRTKGRLIQYTDSSGASNLDELQTVLRSSVMIRRLKEDVLTELPEKQRKILAFPADGYEALLKEEFEIVKRYGFTEERLFNELHLHRVPFEEISAARKATGIAKVRLVLEHVRGVLDSSRDKKVILFAHHQDVLTKLYDGLEDYGVAIVRGETSQSMREQAVGRFQGNPYTRLFLGSIGAAGVGITLTAASHVIFAEQSWSPKDMLQAEDRAHRIGQKNCVLVESLVFDGSLDANMIKKLHKKMRVANAALDK